MDPMAIEIPVPQPTTHRRSFGREEITEALIAYLKAGGIPVPEGATRLCRVPAFLNDSVGLTLSIEEKK